MNISINDKPEKPEHDRYAVEKKQNRRPGLARAAVLCVFLSSHVPLEGAGEESAGV